MLTVFNILKTAKIPEGFLTPYFEVGADLQQQPPCSSDIIGGHQLPLEDGQRNIGTWGQIQICNWLQSNWRSGWAVCFVVTLKLYHFHVRQCLYRKEKTTQYTVAFGL